MSCAGHVSLKISPLLSPLTLKFKYLMDLDIYNIINIERISYYVFVKKEIL